MGASQYSSPLQRKDVSADLPGEGLFPFLHCYPAVGIGLVGRDTQASDNPLHPYALNEQLTGSQGPGSPTEQLDLNKLCVCSFVVWTARRS